MPICLTRLVQIYTTNFELILHFVVFSLFFKKFIFLLGWYRTSGERCAPRRQRSQPAQYSGHYHRELLFILSHCTLDLVSFSFEL